MARRNRVSQERTRQSLQRRAGRRPPRSITLIVCEGETEQEYFEAVRIHYGLTGAEVVLAENSRGSAPISVVECAEGKCAEPGGYDCVYCVFDRDGHESFDRARAKIKSLSTRARNPLPIREAISIPCFEFWVLLHFERTDAPFHRCVDAIARVRRYLPAYEKADAAIARQLITLMDTAVTHAAWLENRAEENNLNPYTSVNHVLGHLKAVAASTTMA